MNEKTFLNFVVVNEADQILSEQRELPPYCATIQSGCSLSEKRIADYSDDSGEFQISDRNPCYSEFTALYWVWKNKSSDYIGWSHYRRAFQITEDELREFMEQNGDVILPPPVLCPISVSAQYNRSHYNAAWDTMMEVLREKEPVYYELANYFFEQDFFFSCCMGIYKYEHFDSYCSWLFPILDEIYKRVEPQWDIYQNRFIAFLGERLHSLYFCVNAGNLNIRYVYFEVFNTTAANISFQQEDLYQKVETEIFGHQIRKLWLTLINLSGQSSTLTAQFCTLYDITSAMVYEQLFTNNLLCRHVADLKELIDYYNTLDSLIKRLVHENTPECCHALWEYQTKTNTSVYALKLIIFRNIKGNKSRAAEIFTSLAKLYRQKANIDAAEFFFECSKETDDLKLELYL